METIDSNTRSILKRVCLLNVSLNKYEDCYRIDAGDTFSEPHLHSSHLPVCGHCVYINITHEKLLQLSTIIDI